MNSQVSAANQSIIPKEIAILHKQPQVRTYDENGLRRRVYCLCMNSQGNVLLITASRAKHLYVLPGGGIDPGESIETAVIRELYEEAGVNAEIDSFLDEHINLERNRRSFVYKCRYISQDNEWPESKVFPFRDRYWAKDIDEAISIVKEFKKEHIGVLEMLRKNKGSSISNENERSRDSLIDDHQ